MGAQRFVVDETAASIVFTASSSVHPIRSVGSVSGWIEADISNGGFAGTAGFAGHLEVPIAGLSSVNPLIDRELKRRVDAAIHTVISADVEEALRARGDRAMITGTIEFLGIATLVEGDIVLMPELRIVGSGEFDVRWWGLEPPRLLMLRVDPVVTVDIDLPLVDGR